MTSNRPETEGAEEGQPRPAPLYARRKPFHPHGVYYNVRQPESYVSPLGRYRLRVDPSERHGNGPAHYRLTGGDEEVWSGPRPFTFWQADVGDDGAVAGFGYSRPKPGEYGVFLVAILGPDGDVRLYEEYPQTPARAFHAPPDPVASQVIVDPDNDRVIFRVNDADHQREAESWWVHRLSTGRPLKRFEPKLLMPTTDRVWIALSARPVSGTELILVHWLQFRDHLLGATYTLVDPDGRPVWRLDLPGEYEITNPVTMNRLRHEIREHGTHVDPAQPRRFTLCLEREAQAVTFEIAPERLSVSERSRSPFLRSVSSAPSLELLPKISLEPLPPLTLPEALIGADYSIRSAALGPDDRIYVLAGGVAEDRARPLRVYAFDLDGAPVRVWEAPLTEPPFFHQRARIELDPEGRVYVGPLWSIDEQLLVTESCYLRTAREGAGLEPVELPGMEGDAWLLQPGTRRRWVLPGSSVTLLDAEEHPICRHERHPDGSWIERVRHFGAAPDGTLAILETPAAPEGEDFGFACLSRYSPTGEPLTTHYFPLPGGPIRGLALSLSYAVLIGRTEGLLLNPSDGRVQRFDLPDLTAAESRFQRLLLSTAGTELLLYDTDHTFHRFRLPSPQR